MPPMRSRFAAPCNSKELLALIIPPARTHLTPNLSLCLVRRRETPLGLSQGSPRLFPPGILATLGAGSLNDLPWLPMTVVTFGWLSSLLEPASADGRGITIARTGGFCAQPSPL